MSNSEYENNNTSDEYENKPNNDYSSNENVNTTAEAVKEENSYSAKINSGNDINMVLNTISFISYCILSIAIFLNFIPISEGSWFTLGMGKLVLLGAILGIAAILRKNYFAAFFISLFAAFFVVHETIIFYDSYAINMGRELGQDGVFRSVIELFRDAFDKKCGAFWAGLSSVLSLVCVSIAWVKNIIYENNQASLKEI